MRTGGNLCELRRVLFQFGELSGLVSMGLAYHVDILCQGCWSLHLAVGESKVLN